MTIELRTLAPLWRRLILFVLVLGCLVFRPGGFLNEGGAQAKTPGKTYCFLRVCHRVLTLSETRRRVGKRHPVIASHYNDCRRDRFNPCGLTSSGAVFRANQPDNAASPIYPNGTRLLVWNPRNKRTVEVRINNAGPYWGRRTLDLSRAAADKLGFRRQGVARLMVQVLSAPTRRQARYRRYRKYAPVRGYVGRFASMDAAARAVTGWTRVPRIAGLTPTLPVPRAVAIARAERPRPVVVAQLDAPRGRSITVPLPIVRPAGLTAVVRQRKRIARQARIRLAALTRQRSAKQVRSVRRKQTAAKPAAKRSPASAAKKPVTARARPRVAPKPKQANKPASAPPAVSVTASSTAAAATTAQPVVPRKTWRRKYFGMAEGSS